MPNRRISSQNVGSLDSNGKSHEMYWDTKITGFGLRVYKTGRRSYIVRYQAATGTKQETLGRYPRMSVKEAQAAALDLIEGADRVQAGTLADFWPRFLKDKSGLKNGSLKNVTSMYERYLKPTLGDVPMWRVKREHIRALLPNDRSASTRDGVRRVASTIWSTARDLNFGKVENNPAQFKLREKMKPRSRKFSRSEIERLWHEVGMMPTLQRAALQVIVLTAQRMNQVLSMEWSELDGPTWKVPPRELNKSGREIWIPLAPVVVKILDEIRELELDDVFVFPSMRSDSSVGHMSRMSKTHKRITERAEVADARCHDWRRTFTSFALKPVVPNDPAATAGLGLPLSVVAGCLSHAPDQDELAWSHYMDAEDRALYLMPERRRAMSAWADFILEITRG